MSERALIPQAQAAPPAHAHKSPEPEHEQMASRGALDEPARGFGHSFSHVACAPPLRVTSPYEPNEREADRVADEVVAPANREPICISAAPAIHGASGVVQRFSSCTSLPTVPASVANGLTRGDRTGQPHAPGTSPSFVPSSTAARLTGSTRPAGAALDSASRAEFEPRLGRNLDEVRVHTDAAAANDARALNARAFTHGQDIFFGASAYKPHTSSGRWLLAHEVAHTQQAAPGVVSRFVADAPIPAAPDTREMDDSGSESPGSIADEIENTLDTDPDDKSGQAAGRLAKLPPSKRKQAASTLRSKQEPARKHDAAGVVSRPAREPQTDTAKSSSVRIPGPRREHPPGSREEQTRRSVASTVSPRAPQTPASGVRSTSTPAGIFPRVPPSLTRTSVQPQPPSQLPTSPAKEQPGLATLARDELKGADAAERMSVSGRESSGESSPAGDAKGPAASGDEDVALRLSDLFEPADPQLGRNGTKTTSRAPSSEPGQSASGNDSAFSGAFSSSRGIGGAPAGDFGPTQRLALPLGLAEENAEEVLANEEPRNPAEIAAEMEGYAAQLESALATARETLQTKADSVRNAVRQSAASSRAGMRASVDRAAAAIQAGGNSLLSELARSVSAAHATVKGSLAARAAEASVKGITSQGRIAGIFAGHRATVERTVNTAVGDAEKLRSGKVESAKRRNQADIKTAYARGGAKLRSYPGTNRGSFVGGAAFDIAEGTANEMRNQEPDIVAAINEVTAPLPQHFRDQGAEALNGFDQNLPEIIASVTTGVTQTQGELTQRAGEARQQLDQFARDTEREITGMMEDAIRQARDILPPAEQQLDRALGEILRSIGTSSKDVSARLGPPVEEAIELFRTGQDADVESAPQLTEVLLSFVEESIASTTVTLEQASVAAKERFQAMSGGTRRAMRELQTRADDAWKGSRSGISTTVARSVESADTGLGGVVKTFGDALGETEQSIRDQLSPVVSDLKGSFDKALKDAEVDIDSRIGEGMAKNTEALGDLDAKMQEAADEAAWEWDHPVLSTLSFIAGILVGIITVLAMLVALIVIVILLAKVLAVSALVAGIILLVGMVAFSIGYGFGARLAAGQGVGEALGGAVIDFGRAAPGMLYEMTGIPKLKRAFSDERMTPYERGKLVGEGATEFVVAIFAVRGAAKGIATGFRKLPRIPWRRPVRVPASTAPTATPPRAPAAAGTSAAGRPPAATPPASAGTASPAKIAPIEPAPPTQTGGLRSIPGGKQPSGAPRPAPELRPIEGGAGRPANVAPEPAPTAQRPGLRAIEGGGELSSAPRPSPDLRVIEGGRARGPSGPPEPTPPRPQAQRAAKAAGAEGQEPLIGEQVQPQRPGLTVHEGGAARPGGRSPLEVRASAEPPGGGGPRPGRSSSAGQGGRSSAGVEGPPAGRAGPGTRPAAGSGRGAREVPGERPSTTEPGAKPVEGPAEVKAEPVKADPGKGAAPKKEPAGGRPRERTPQEKAQERLSELQQQKADKDAELKALRKQRESLRQQHDTAVKEKQAALDEWQKAATAGERQAAREKALAAQQRAKSAREAMEELPGEEGLAKDLKALEKDIGIEGIKADPQSRASLPCFSADTIVLTPDGPRAIAGLQPGDVIWSFDFSTGTRKARPVRQLHRGRTGAFHTVQTAQGAVRATSQHRFWVETDSAWRTAETLVPGMRLRNLDGMKLEIVGTKKEPVKEVVTFNLSIDEFQTYFVGPGMLVHNDAVDIGLGGDYTIYRATNPKFPGKVYIGQTTELDAQGKPRGVEARQVEHRDLAREKLRLDAEGIEKLSPRDRAHYEFMKDAKLEPTVKGISNQAQADYLEQHNIDIERKISGENNVMNRRNQITSESHLKEIVEKIKADPAVKAKGYCP